MKATMFTLAPPAGHFYVAAMRVSALILTLFLAWIPPISLFGQALSVDAEEFKRMAGELADLRDANLAQQRRITALQREVESLRSAVRDSQEKTISRLGEFATREDLKKIVDQIKEVDQRREADRKLILQEFENLGKALTQPAPRAAARRNDPEPRSEPEKPIEGTFIEYVVQPNESLSEIRVKYNSELQKQGRPPVSIQDIVRANPRLNPDRIFVGQKINLPVPEKKR